MATNSKPAKYVYLFGNKKADGDGTMKPLLGGKGPNLAEMTRIGLPVPPGFTITTEVCSYFYEHKKTYPKVLAAQTEAAITRLEELTGRKFGDAENPLLVSVRSGARASMPGMMDTILNLGLNDTTVRALIRQTDNPRFGWDSYRRFVQMFGNVVLGVAHDDFEHLMQRVKEERGARLDTDLSAQDLERLTGMYKAHVLERTGKP